MVGFVFTSIKREEYEQMFEKLTGKPVKLKQSKVIQDCLSNPTSIASLTTIFRY